MQNRKIASAANEIRDKGDAADSTVIRGGLITRKYHVEIHPSNTGRFAGLHGRDHAGDEPLLVEIGHSQLARRVLAAARCFRRWALLASLPPARFTAPFAVADDPDVSRRGGRT